MNSCQYIVAPDGTFKSLEPVWDSTSYLERKTSLLISVKANQVIWVDFENLDVRRQKVKVLCCSLYSVIGNEVPPVLLLF